MGTVDGVPAGKKLFRDQWNSQLYGPLNDLKVEGLKAGTDLYFNKSKLDDQASHGDDSDVDTDRLSGLWGAQTPLGLWLQENSFTTLLFGGVNTDQCVVS